MYFFKGNSTLSGERIRKYCEEHHITQWDLAEILGFKGRNEVSNCWNGIPFKKENKYEILSKEWNMRKEYLMGIDDYPTDKAKNLLLPHKEYKDLIFELLSHNGYSIKETNYVISLNHVYDITKENPENELYTSSVWEITKDNNTRIILDKDIYNLINDFIALLETRIKPHGYLDARINQ